MGRDCGKIGLELRDWGEDIEVGRGLASIDLAFDFRIFRNKYFEPKHRGQPFLISHGFCFLQISIRSLLSCNSRLSDANLSPIFGKTPYMGCSMCPNANTLLSLHRNNLSLPYLICQWQSSPQGSCLLAFLMFALTIRNLLLLSKRYKFFNW